MLKKILVPLLVFCTIFTVKVSAAEFEMVSYSALVKLQWLSYSGQPEAKKILKTLKVTNLYDKKNLPDYERLEKLNSIYQELNYASTVEYVRNKGYGNILDIGGGFTPRAVVFARDGRKYYGAELMAVAVSATDVMSKVLNKKDFQNVTYDEVLVEDREAMLNAADEFNGKICIIENGLMIYLTEDRATEMFKLVKEVLQKHGGCFISTDYVTKDYFKEIAAALYGEDQADLLYGETKVMYEQLFDNPIFDDTFKTQDEALKFFAAHGLKVEQVPLLTDTSKLYCLKTLTPQQVEKIKQVAAKNYLWVITAE
jgi:hypothetical protein